MTQSTRGIVIRTVRYGETSVIVNIYTELFGLQSYIVNGVRTNSKKGHGKGNSFQPAAILDLVVYHNEIKNLQRIKEFRWGYLYEHVFFSVMKNAVAMYMIELLQKCLKQPEPNHDLYHFIEDAFIHLDQCSDAVLANYPLYFTLHLAGFFGLQLDDNYSEANPILDLQEGQFTCQMPDHPYYLEGELSFLTSHLLKIMQPQELEQLKLNHEIRRRLLTAYLDFLAYHLPEFGVMKSLPVLQTVLGGR